MKNWKKISKNKLREFEKSTHELMADCTGITQIHLLETTQALYRQGQYKLVAKICKAAIRNRTKQTEDTFKRGVQIGRVSAYGKVEVPAGYHKGSSTVTYDDISKINH